MAGSHRDQQEAFHKLTKLSKDRANNAIFTTIKTYDGEDRQAWTDKIDQACRVSRHDFRTEIIKKSTGVVCQVVMAYDNLSGDDLLAKLRISFSDTPIINQVWEDLRSLRQGEHDCHCVCLQMGMCSGKITRDHYRKWKAPLCNKGLHLFTKKIIRNKIANKWVEMKRKPCTV